jgi:hypothetical protein
MRIDNSLPAYYTNYLAGLSAGFPANVAGGYNSAQQIPQQANNPSRSGIILDISPEGWARSRAVEKASSIEKIAALTECKTCKNRKYQDSSDDPSVSFQTPTHISPGESASAVMAHEGEHVSNEKAKAAQEGRRVVSQTVTLETSICPECGRVYVSGGVTRTVTASDTPQEATANEV